MNSNTPIAVIGAGHLGSSIVKHLIDKGHRNLTATRRNLEELKKLQSLSTDLKLTTDDAGAVREVEVIVLCTKEAQFPEVAEIIKPLREGKLLISVGPMYSLEKLSSSFGPKNIRLITPVNPNEDLICYCADDACSAEDDEIVRSIFGDNVKKVSEDQMPVATAYVLFRGILNSFFDPLVNVGSESGFDDARVVMGKMLISCGQEMVHEVSAEERLSNASGGLNEASFTMKLYKQIQPAQDLLTTLFEKVCKDFKQP